MAFVATSAPQGWKLGRWSQVSKNEWQEEKLDSPEVVYKFQVLSGPSTPGSKTMRLKMKDQNTEVLLLESSAQVFVNGNYLGEYVGEWQSGGKGRAAPARGAAASKEPAPVKETAPPAKTSKEQPAFEQTRAPEPQKKEKETPQKKEKKAAAAASAPRVSEPPPVTSVDRSEFQPWQAPDSQRKGKASGLDKSDASMAKLIGAAKNGDVSQVKQLLESGVDPDGPAKDGQTPLMAATRGGHTAVVEALLGACADPTLGKGDETPLTIAFQKGNQNLLKVLFAGSFNNLNSMVGPNAVDYQSSGAQGDSNVPDNAEYELREMTAKIAAMNTKDGPSSPKGSNKYGNYSHLTTGKDMDMDSADTDMLRAESVKMTMKQLAKTNKDGGLGTPASPK